MLRQCQFRAVSESRQATPQVRLSARHLAARSLVAKVMIILPQAWLAVPMLLSRRCSMAAKVMILSSAVVVQISLFIPAVRIQSAAILQTAIMSASSQEDFRSQTSPSNHYLVVIWFSTLATLMLSPFLAAQVQVIQFQSVAATTTFTGTAQSL